MTAISMTPAPSVTTLKQRKRLKGIRYKVRMLPFQLGFGHLGKFAVIALYYILLQTMRGQHTTILSWGVTLPDVKGTWDHLLSANTAHGGLFNILPGHRWDTIRHLIRSVYEGIFGVVLYKLAGWNPYKYQKKLERGPKPWDRFVLKYLNWAIASPYQEHFITPMQFAFVPLIITLASIPGLAIGYGVVQVLHHVAHATWLSPHLSAHPSFAAKFYADGYDAVVVGIFAGFLAGRSYNPVLDSVFKYFARRRVAKGKRFHFYSRWMYPVAYVVFCDELQEHPDAMERQQEALAARNKWVGPMLMVGALMTLALAGFGYYVIAYIA